MTWTISESFKNLRFQAIFLINEKLDRRWIVTNVYFFKRIKNSRPLWSIVTVTVRKKFPRQKTFMLENCKSILFVEMQNYNWISEKKNFEWRIRKHQIKFQKMWFVRLKTLGTCAIKKTWASGFWYRVRGLWNLMAAKYQIDSSMKDTRHVLQKMIWIFECLVW